MTSHLVFVQMVIESFKKRLPLLSRKLASSDSRVEALIQLNKEDYPQTPDQTSEAQNGCRKGNVEAD